VTPLVSVIIPCRNEARFIAVCLDSILASDYPRFEVIVADGMSADGTREIVARYGEVQMIDNPRKITPAGLNLAIGAARGEIILRMDAHARVARDYISGCVAALERTGADNVGGIRIEVARDPGFFAAAIVEAMTQPFGVGNALYRTMADREQWVDTVFGGCWRREIFCRIGMFHERLARSQDIEFNQRLRRAGGRILLSPALVTYYYTRSWLRDLIRHNFVNGAWSVLPFALTGGGMPVRWRHLAPLAMVSTVCVCALAGFYWPAVAYAAANLSASAWIAARKKRWNYVLTLPVVFASLHFSYGTGSLWGLARIAAMSLVRSRAVRELDMEATR